MENNDLIGNLRNAADALEKFQQASQETQTGLQNAMQEDSTNEDSNAWNFEDTIDTLISRITGGYTYYNIPWDERNKPKRDNNRYNVMDDSGDNIEVNKTAEEVLDFANTLFHYDMADNDESELKSFDDAKNALESNGYKVVNVEDTNQLSLFPKEKKEKVEVSDDKVLSKMSDSELDRIYHNMDPFKANGLKKAIQLLKLNKQQEAYTALRSLMDSLREEKINENNFVDSKIFTIIAESEKPKLTKEDILTFIKKNKNEKSN